MRPPIVVSLFLLSLLPIFAAQPGTPDIAGVYQAIPDKAVAEGGLKNSGAPSSVSLLPSAAPNADPKQDPWKMCQPVGPFRMMAAPRTKLEFVPTDTMIAMLFEDLSHGVMRTIYLRRPHAKQADGNWLGDSTGRWEGDTLVIDTIGFNDRTWLNENGAQHSDALHLVERVRPVAGGKYLEYKVTAEDPKALTKPYTYVRYYEKLASEIMEDVCENQP